MLSSLFRVLFAALLLPLFSLSPSALAADAADAPEEYTVSWQSLSMGTVVSARVFAPEADEARRLALLVQSEIERFEDMMSVHKETVLNEVNRRSGEAVEVTPEIAEMTREALWAAGETDGAFDPTIGTVVNLWKIGFGGSSVPSDEDVARAASLVDYRKVHVTEEGGKNFLQVAPGQSLDMGGIAKGYIGQKLAESLKREGAVHALLDLGGNVVAVGEKLPGAPWRIGLQWPDQTRGAYFAVVGARDESVITSGAYERNFEKDGERYGHILSGKTGRPAVTDIGSVTIVDRNGARADALCTALFGMGWEKARSFLAAHRDVEAVLLKNDLKTVLVTAGLLERFSIASEGMAVETLP